MKVWIIQFHGYNNGRYDYTVEAENGIIERESGDQFFPLGTTFEAPDHAWQPDSAWFQFKCGGCGHEYWDHNVPGGTATCEVCGDTEHIPEDAVGGLYEGDGPDWVLLDTGERVCKSTEE